MNPHFVSDGEKRLHRDPEFQARLQALREAIRERHAGKMAGMRLFERLVLRWKMEMEYWRERNKIVPSPHSLYAANQIDRH